MVNTMLMVGSSMAIGFSGSGLRMSQIESPISKPSIPTSAQISPDFTSLVLVLPSPVKVCNSLILDLTTDPSRFTRLTSMFSRKVPRCTRPTAIRPT
ncbi:hypothetical protein SDC9_167637 [bioreactor metagenome]|uniref:Uncharacterized protein n=1 Tax=bioreactor metagenome TaxID=1076179 RepID=A0A645G364_9ZZZZ